MEIDAKTIGVLLASIAAGGGTGVVSSELNIKAEVAALEAELDGLRTNIETLVKKGDGEVAEIRLRIDRLDARKMDKVQ